MSDTPELDKQLKAIKQARAEGEERGKMMTCEAHIARAEQAEDER